MQRQDNKGDKFRIDGYYFSSGEARDTSKINSVILFYRNGVFKHHKSYNQPVSSHVAEEELVGEARVPRPFLEGFGYYVVRRNSITIEYWGYASHFPVSTLLVEGRALNDSTLDVEIFERNQKQLWHFKQLSPKPDSTTIFDEQLEKGLPIKRGKKQKLLGII